MSKRKLLLADDSVTIQKVVKLTFADEGIEVISVGDGNSAMSAFADTNPDIVLADVNMPGLSGYEVCERIRSGGSRSNVPVVLLVGSFEQFDQARADQVGANAHITKPFQSIRQVVTTVTELLAGAAAPVAAGAPSFQPVVTMPNVGDELVETYTPNTIRIAPVETQSDDILEGSELDALLSGRKEPEAEGFADDFSILDIPLAPSAPPQAVQPERPVPTPLQPVFVPPPLNTEQQNPFSAPVAPVPPSPAAPIQTVPEISPEVIELIAEKLSQKISEDAVREIANRIVPEVTAMIIKKMVEQASKR